MIEASDPFLSEPRINRARFSAILRERANPAVVAERDPGEYWDAIVHHGVDPLVILAMFHHESGLGKHGVAVQTHSFGNTRAPSLGAEPVGSVPGRTGTFPIFRDWLDGCVSTVARLASDAWPPGAPYGLRGSLREIFDHPSGQVWAPAGDLNDPGGYLASVLAFMNAESDAAAADKPARPVVDLRGQLVRNPQGGPQERLPLAQKRGGVVIHHTGPDPVAAGTEVMLLKAFANDHALRRDWSARLPGLQAGDGLMYHLVIGLDGTIYRTRDLDESLWHCGDTSPADRNRTAFAVLLMVGGDQAATPAQLAAAVLVSDWLLALNGLPASEVRGHGEVSATDCPGPLLEQLVRPYRAGAFARPAPDDRSRHFPETGQTVAHGFLAFWEALGDEVALRVLGYPLTGEMDDAGMTVQYFERAVLEHHPDAPPGWTVQLRRLGALAAQAAGLV